MVSRLKEFRINNIIPLIGDGNFVLDIGSEGGEVTKKMREKNNVVVSDIDAVQLKNLGGMGVCLDGNRTLPFSDNSFDAITAFELIEHLHDFLRFLSESYRVLKPGGRLFITTPNFLNVKHRVQMVFGSLPHFEPNFHISPFTFKNAHEFLEKAGFKIEMSKAITKGKFHNKSKSLGGGIFIVAVK